MAEELTRTEETIALIRADERTKIARRIRQEYWRLRDNSDTINLWKLLMVGGLGELWEDGTSDDGFSPVRLFGVDSMDADTAHGDGYAAVRQDSA